MYLLGYSEFICMEKQSTLNNNNNNDNSNNKNNNNNDSNNYDSNRFFLVVEPMPIIIYENDQIL